MTVSKLTYGLIAAAVLGPSLLAGCGADTTDGQQARGGDGTDSNTHWLGSCKEDSDCDDDLQCVCGVCSTPCEDTAACDDLGASAQCVQALCDRESKDETGLCSRGCDSDDDCPDDGSCEQGVCAPKNASVVPAPVASPCAAMDVQQLELPCDSVVEYYWAGGVCLPQATCSCSGADCDAMFATEEECRAAYSECVPTSPTPSEVPDGCDFLLEPSATGPCGVDDERCQRMRADGRVHTFECSTLSEYSGQDGEVITLTEAERTTRNSCVNDWLMQAGGATDVASSDGGVRASGSWDQVGALFNVNGVVCTPDCENGTCDYCHELGESPCASDAFCWVEEGSRVDEVAECEQPSEFAACLPYDVECGRAFGLARDPEGQCWTFGWVCDKPGFTEVSDVSDSCRGTYPDCSTEPPEPPVEGCEAMDTVAGPQCDPNPKFTWNGVGCTPFGCDCQGADCERLFDSREACQAHWAGCIDSVPGCSAERVPPSATGPSFAWGRQVDEPQPSFDEWTATVWTTPVELPILVAECPEVAGFDGNACGSIKGLTLEEGFTEPLRLQLALPDDVWSRIDVAQGDAIELRMNETELAIRTSDDQLPLILVGIGGAQGSATAEWSFAPFTVQTGDPFCKRPDNDEPDCNWLYVEQTLRVRAPLDAPPNAPGEREQQTVTLEPFRALELPVGTDAGSALYHVMHGRGMYGARNRPNLESCAVAFLRVDGFSVVRVVDDTP